MSSAFLASILSDLTRVNIEMTFFLSNLEYLLLFSELQKTGCAREPFLLLILNVCLSLFSLSTAWAKEHKHSQISGIYNLRCDLSDDGGHISAPWCHSWLQMQERKHQGNASQNKLSEWLHLYKPICSFSKNTVTDLNNSVSQVGSVVSLSDLQMRKQAN